MQNSPNFPQILPSSFSKYPLKIFHPNTRGNFVLSSYEPLRMVPRTPLYISPWKSFSRCGEFFSNPNSKPFKHKLENLFPSLFSPLMPWPGPALPHFPFFLHRPSLPAVRPTSALAQPCPRRPLPTLDEGSSQRRRRSHAARRACQRPSPMPHLLRSSIHATCPCLCTDAKDHRHPLEALTLTL